MEKVIAIMDYIGKILFRWTIFILKNIYDSMKDFIFWVMDKYRTFQFVSIYKAFLIINFILLFINLTIFNTIIIINILIQLILIIFILYKLISNKKKISLELYLKHIKNWSFYALIVLLLSYGHILRIVPNVSKVFQYILYIQLFVVLHYWYRGIIYKYVKHWVMYSLYFLILPLISLFIWIAVGDTLSIIFEMPILVSDTVLGYMIIIFTIFIFNFEIYVAPKEIRSEVKLAVYLILAVYSTISYCFFLSDYLSESIFNLLNPYSNEFINEGINISQELIMDKVEWLLKWYTLPHLIAAVFGSFTLELVSRNDKI